MIRSSIGLYVDRQWERNTRRSLKYGLLRCTYHFLKADRSIKDQALLAVSLANQRPVEMGIYCDVEHDTLGQIPTAKQVKTFSEIVTINYDGPYGIYTSKYQWSSLGANTGWASKYLLCVADWGGLDKPRLPEPWNKWELWQYSNRGKLCGKRIDLQMASVGDSKLREKYG